MNKYRTEEKSPFEVLDIDNTAVREEQIAKLNEIKAKRDSSAVATALTNLENAARDGGNLLEFAVEAVRVRATVGEVSDALRNVFGEHKATIRTVSSVYAGEYQVDDSFEEAKSSIANFAENQGRQPRILIVKLGQDGHDRGAKVIATGFADLGFDVDIGPLFQTPEEAAKQAVENDVHVIGVSSQAAGHKTLVPALKKALADEDAADIQIVVGGIIPEQDYDFLYENGASAIFGPGTPIPQAAVETVKSIEKALN